MIYSNIIVCTFNYANKTNVIKHNSNYLLKLIQQKDNSIYSRCSNNYLNYKWEKLNRN
jgi:hypothetical protein